MVNESVSEIMARARDWSELDEWMNDNESDIPKPEPDAWSIERTFPYQPDSAPAISYVELAWLGYYTVKPVSKGWNVETSDGVVFHNADRRQAVREAQIYCSAKERGEVKPRHLPEHLRPLKYKVASDGEPPF